MPLLRISGILFLGIGTYLLQIFKTILGIISFVRAQMQNEALNLQHVLQLRSLVGSIMITHTPFCQQRYVIE
jgi:hypothetical protein